MSEMIEEIARCLAFDSPDGHTIEMLHADTQTELRENAARVLRAALAHRDASGSRVLYLTGELEQVGWLTGDGGYYRRNGMVTDAVARDCGWSAVFRLDPVAE
jgi:hypothetical protein